MYSTSQQKQSLHDIVLHLKHRLLNNPLGYLKIIRSTRTLYFACNRESYKYAKFLKNSVYASERTIELPIVMKYVNECKGSILEVGNVLNQYYSFSHTIVDKYEISKNVINVDIVDFAPDTQYDLTISISTLEHIGFDEEDKDSTKILKALDKLFSATKNGGQVLITVPLGYNPFLDSYLKHGLIKAPEMHLMRRISMNNEWVEQSLELLKTENFVYSSPYPFANWVLIMRWIK